MPRIFRGIFVGNSMMKGKPPKKLIFAKIFGLEKFE